MMVWEKSSKQRTIDHLVNVHNVEASAALDRSKRELQHLHGQLQSSGDKCKWRA